MKRRPRCPDPAGPVQQQEPPCAGAVSSADDEAQHTPLAGSALAAISSEVGPVPKVSLSASTVYTSHFSPAGPVTHTLSWVAKQQVVPISSSVNKPSPVSRAISSCTTSLDSTSTPR